MTTRPGECTFTSKAGTYLSVSVGTGGSARTRGELLFTDYAHVPGSVVRPINGTTTLWVPFPLDVGGGGRLVALQGSKLTEVDVTAGVPTPMATASRAMKIALQEQ
jgi:hypothetical protein